MPRPSASAQPWGRLAGATVAAGIFLSRIAGFIRDRVFAHYLGNSDAAGAFRAALRIPNLLQNLFGEGVLSASFIPVYARLLAAGKPDEATRVASVILTLLTCVMAILVALGVTLSRPLIDVLAPGFEGDVRDLTIRLVAIMFPGTGLLVLSAWCLGVLNSHRKFFLAYVAPVLWNLAIILALLGGGHVTADRAAQMDLAVWVAWATVLGAALQCTVQAPAALRLNHGYVFSLCNSEPVRRIIRTFLPSVLTRGVVQISAYIDQILASYLGPQIVAAMAYAQTLYTLPVSLFGMAISATELTEMSRVLGSQEEIRHSLATRLTAGLTRLSFYTVPSVVAFVVLGEVLVTTLFQTGKFGPDDAVLVWLILAGSAVGLLATTQGRLCVSAMWALGDTRTPLRFASLRVVLTGLLGYLVTFPLRASWGIPPGLSAAGLTASAGLVGWLEFWLMRRALGQRLGPFMPPWRALWRFWCAAAGAAGIAWLVGHALAWRLAPTLAGGLTLCLYGALYLGIACACGVSEAQDALRLIRHRLLSH